MTATAKSYPSARALEVLCPTGAFCGKPCTGRGACEHINSLYDPDWREREAPAEGLSCLTDDEWAAIMADWEES